MTHEKPVIATLVLAAGLSRRLGSSNKLLKMIEDRPLLDLTLETIERAKIGPVLIVLGHQSEVIAPIAQSRTIETIYNPSFAEGMASSIAAGIAHLAAEDMDAVLICLGDMPFISPDTFRQLADTFDNTLQVHQSHLILAPAQNGLRGHPVLFGRHYFDELLQLHGDQGAKSLLMKYKIHVREVPVDDPGILRDFDTLEDFAHA